MLPVSNWLMCSQSWYPYYHHTSSKTTPAAFKFLSHFPLQFVGTSSTLPFLSAISCNIVIRQETPASTFFQTGISVKTSSQRERKDAEKGRQQLDIFKKKQRNWHLPKTVKRIFWFKLNNSLPQAVVLTQISFLNKETTETISLELKDEQDTAQSRTHF